MSNGDPHKHEIPWSVVLKVGAGIIWFLAALMLNDIRDDLKEVKNVVTDIRIKNQHLEDRIETNSNAINELRHTSDYLQKTKQDK